uniref:PH domain-containing protein n=1 Tax=Chelonoidis abingdonii TaxID=106734 RepID=A0A8C0IQW8_CHEAB
DLGSKESPENRIGSRSRGPESPTLPKKGMAGARSMGGWWLLCWRELPCPVSSFLAGVATRLSRRRVSCRELGKVDCDGWLLKKKDHVGFMSQKWKRFWFVLKGHVLYWYNQPSDEKAVGLINVSTYNLESTREQKKKYVFQLLELEMGNVLYGSEGPWLVRAFLLIVPSVLLLPDCYSETEAEDPDDDVPRPGSDLVSVIGEEGGSYSPAGENSPGEELESLIKCLKQGGVSLIGTCQLLTHEQYRKSFIKRNKNPQINERVHLVRALQSTLKAKVAELQILDQLLNDSELTSEKFRHWKEENQELYQEIHQWWVPRPSQAEGLEAELDAESTGSPLGQPPLPVLHAGLPSRCCPLPLTDVTQLEACTPLLLHPPSAPSSGLGRGTVFK